MSHYFFSKWVVVGALIFSFEGMYIWMSTKQTIIFRWGTSKWKTKQKKKRSQYKPDQQESTTWWDALIPFLSELLVEPFTHIHLGVRLCMCVLFSYLFMSSYVLVFSFCIFYKHNFCLHIRFTKCIIFACTLNSVIWYLICKIKILYINNEPYVTYIYL